MLIPSFKLCCCCWPPVARLLAPGLHRMSLIYKISFIKPIHQRNGIISSFYCSLDLLSAARGPWGGFSKPEGSWWRCLKLQNPPDHKGFLPGERWDVRAPCPVPSQQGPGPCSTFARPGCGLLKHLAVSPPCFSTAQTGGDGAARHQPARNNQCLASRPRGPGDLKQPRGGDKKALGTVLSHPSQRSPSGAGWGMSCAAATWLQK